MSLSSSGRLLLLGALCMGCTSGGREFWLYPEPRLPQGEDAVFAAYETHRLLFLDAEDAATTCWGERRMASQAYTRNDRVCRLHLRPGRHSAVFQTGPRNTQTATVDFQAQAGKTYGLRRSGCMASAIGIQGNCRFEVVEVRGRSG